MYKGSCLCGAVQYEVNGHIHSIVHCHCSQCRKAQGSAFATNGIVKASDFRYCSGEQNLTAYESTPGQKKYFCKICGSPIASITKSKLDQVRIRLGTLTSDIVERPMAHIFTTSKANWETINGNLPQYEAYEPGRQK